MPIIRFRPELADDLRTAVDWYDAKRTGLGDEFLGEYWSAIERITDQPLAYGVTHAGLRACRLSRFPYVVHFRCNEEGILVVAVMFGGRDAPAWIDRV
jgi:plasmid stabilization system protein ParE